MMDATKYRVGYFPVGRQYNKWVEKDHVEKPPVWCSVDMRDGNQSLVIPITLEKKMEYYKVLIRKAFGCRRAYLPSTTRVVFQRGLFLPICYILYRPDNIPLGIYLHPS